MYGNRAARACARPVALTCVQAAAEAGLHGH